MTEFIRIKKGVKPYGGYRAEVTGRYEYPNGRRVVNVKVDHSRFLAIREYNEDEVETLAETTREVGEGILMVSEQTRSNIRTVSVKDNQGVFRITLRRHYESQDDVADLVVTLEAENRKDATLRAEERHPDWYMIRAEEVQS